MFDKLRKRLIIINMCLLTFVFVSIFSVIYVVMANTTQRQIDFALKAAITGPRHPHPENPSLGSAILVDMNEQGEIVDSFSFMNIDSGTISLLTGEAQAVDSSSGNIKMDSTHYAFLKEQLPYGITKLAFIDRTPQQRALHNLLIIFISVGGLSLVVLFFVSLYLANKTVAPIKETFEKQKQFIADASHELKTPLSVIKTNAALVLQNKEATVSSQGKWLDYILFQADRMSQLLDAMLSLAKIDYSDSEAGAKEAISKLDLSSLVMGSALSFEGFMFEKNINFAMQIEPGIELNGNKENIKRLIDILIDNAVKHTPGGGEVSLALSSTKDEIELKITNTGEGIPEEHLNRIFERFYRVDASRSIDSGGYGLGLSIAKTIVEQHKGTISVESNPGVDTTFKVEFGKSSTRLLGNFPPASC